MADGKVELDLELDFEDWCDKTTQTVLQKHCLDYEIKYPITLTVMLVTGVWLCRETCKSHKACR